MKRADYVWQDGRIVPWEQATVHVLTHSLHYGLAVFEGIRCYRAADGPPAIFRLREHMVRLERSARILGMTMPHTVEALEQAAKALIRKNRQQACYIRPIVFFGSEKVGLDNTGCVSHAAIITWEWGAYLGEAGLAKGIRCRVSSFTRAHPNVMMSRAKTTGGYINSQLARAEATRDGYDEAILLDAQGFAVEGSGENLFLVEDGALVTPPLEGALPGITRASLLEIARDEGIPTREQRITRDRLYTADEVFLTGTAAEVTPVREVDGRPIGAGARGPLTERLQAIFREAVTGERERYRGWLSPIDGRADADGGSGSASASADAEAEAKAEEGAAASRVTDAADARR